MLKKILLLVMILCLPLAIAEESCSTDDESCTVDETELLSFEKEQDVINSIWTEHEEGKICIVYFYSDYCTHCASVESLIDEIEATYAEEIALTKLNVDEVEAFQVYNQFCREKEYRGKEIPMIAIDNKYFVGENDIRENLEDEILRMITSGERICPLAGVMACHSNEEDAQPYVDGLSEEGHLVWYKTLPAIVISGLVDGINPCAFAVLIFMMTILLEVSGSRKRVFKIGLSYMLAFIATNVTLGILVYWFSDLVFKGSSLPLKFAAGLAIIAGGINIKDYFAYGKGFSLQIPSGTKKLVQRWINYASIPAAIVLGIILAVLEAPCSASIYYAILEMLRNKTAVLMQALPYIFLYNIMFILPLVVLFAIIYMGKSTHVLENWRKSHRKEMRLVLGLILVVLGIILLLGWL